MHEMRNVAVMQYGLSDTSIVENVYLYDSCQPCKYKITIIGR